MKRRAVSPVIATILLISLVVAASAMVYFIVVPMLKGSANVDLITIQWFDSDGDSVVDVAYVTIQNTGSANAIISQINVTIDTEGTNVTTEISNANVEGIPFPLTVNPTERIDLVVTFDPSSYVEIGENIFRVKLVYDDELVAFAPDNLKYTNDIEVLDFTVLNPIEDSWASGIIDPQAIATGGYQTSIITYDFALPGGSVILANQTIASNIDSTLYADQDDYEITFYVSDALGQSAEVTRTFGIDNEEIGVDLSLNSSFINPGDFLDVSWIFTIAGAQLINQTLVMGGDVYGYETVFTSASDTTTNHVLTGPKTATIAEDEFTFTIYVKDEAGNLNSNGESFSLIDNKAPETYLITPENSTEGVEGDLLIQVYADDPTGIDTSNFEINFYNTSFELVYVYIQSIEGSATYNTHTKIWSLWFDSQNLPNGWIYVETIVYDLAISPNINVTAAWVKTENQVLQGHSGAVVGKDKILQFNLHNLLLADINITKVIVTWESLEVEDLRSIEDRTTGTKLLDGTFLNNTENVLSTICMIPADTYHTLQIKFRTTQKKDTITNIGKLTFKFYVESYGDVIGYHEIIIVNIVGSSVYMTTIMI